MLRITRFPLNHTTSIVLRVLTSVYNNNAFQFDLFSTSTKTHNRKRHKKPNISSREQCPPCYTDPRRLRGLIKASTDLASLTGGSQAHSLIIKHGFSANVYLATALISMYSEVGSLADARKVFDELPVRNAACWTSLMSAYEQHGCPRRALELFRLMQLDYTVQPDRVAVTVAVSACTALGALDLGLWVYAYVCRNWGKEIIFHDSVLQNALINMYAKCGDVKAARHIFDTASKRDITTWTCIIMGYALHGPSMEALNIFDAMEREIMPNHVTFLAVLMACNHAGLTNEAWQYLESMQKDYKIKPKITHYGCMVDMLCRMGRVEEAYDLITNMPLKPIATIWRTLLSSCSASGNIALANLARANLSQLEPGYAGDDVAMSNAYAKLGFWDEKVGVWSGVGKRRRKPGCSLIEIGNRTREFAVSDGMKWEYEELRGIIKGLTENSKSLLLGDHDSEIWMVDDE